MQLFTLPIVCWNSKDRALTSIGGRLASEIAKLVMIQKSIILWIAES